MGITLLLTGVVGGTEAGVHPWGALQAGSNYTWLQTDWSGGADTIHFPVYPANMIGWTKFYSKGPGITAGTELTLTPTPGSITQTTDLDFLARTLVAVAISGVGTAAEVRLARAVAVWTHLSSNWLLVDVGTDAAPAFADIDNDGDFDLAVGDGTGRVEFFENTGTATSPIWTHRSSDWLLVDVGTEAAPAFADIDNDRDFDLAVGDGTGRVEFFENTGTATSPIWTHRSSDWLPVDVGTDAAPAFADIDNDGDFDLAVGDELGHVEFFENTGTATSPIWTHRSSDWLPVDVGTDAAPAFADIDNDRDFDLAVGDGLGHVEFFENTGTATSPIWTHRSSDWLPVDVGTDAAPAFADIDNDHDFDLAVGDGGGDVEFFRNDTPYLTSGTFISSAIDTGQHSDFTTLDFTILEPTGADLKFQLRTATTEAGLAIAIWRGPTGTTDFYIISGTAINPVHDGHRWIQYKAFFSTTITSVSPTLADITINYQFFPASASLTSSPFNTTNPRNALTQILWTETLPTGTEIRFQVRTAPDLAGVPGTWTVWAGPCDGIAGSFAATFFTDPTGAEPIDADMRDEINDQWMQYKVLLETTDIMVTPILFDVTIRTELVTHIVFPPGKLVIVAPHPVTAAGAVFWLRLPVETIEATLKIFAIDGRLLVSTPLDPLADRYPAVCRTMDIKRRARKAARIGYLFLPREDQG